MTAGATSGWRRSQVAVLLVASFGVVLSGCAAPWPFPQPTPKPKLPDAQQIFRPLEIGPNAGDLATLDPAHIAFGVDYDKAQLLFPGLVTLDEQNKVVDWAAERHEVSADGLTYTFHLRKGMRWSDGAPIDAQTFAYSINRTLDPCTRSKADLEYYLYDIKGAQAFHEAQCLAGAPASATTLIGSSLLAPDALTLRILLKAPAGQFLAALTYATAWATPKQLIDQYGDTWTEHLADGAGFGGNLFKLSKWDHQGHLEMEVNPNFWGQKPALQKIEYTLYQDTDTAWKAYKAGKGDTGFPRAQELDIARTLLGSVFQQAPLLSMSYLTLNWHRAPFDDVRVRTAFSLALDRKATANYTYTTDTHTYTLKGSMQPTIHLLPEGIPGYNPTLSDAAGRSGDAALTPDLATARKLASHYAAEKCHGDFAKCVPVVIKALPNRPTIALVAQAFLEQWQAAFPHWVIIIASIDCMPPPCNQPNPSQRQMETPNLGVDYPDPQNALSLHWQTGAKYNQTFVSVPEADTLMAQADGMSDPATRIPLYQQAEQLLIKEGAAIPYGQPLNTYLVRPRVVGWRIVSFATPLSVWQAIYLSR